MSAISLVRKARMPQQLNIKCQFEYIYQKLQLHMVAHFELLQTVIIMLCAFRNGFWFPDILKMAKYANFNGIVCSHEKVICSQQIKTQKQFHGYMTDHRRKNTMSNIQ